MKLRLTQCPCKWSNLWYSFFLCFSYHTGSLAFGSLILSMVQMVRIVLEYLDHKLKGKTLLLQHIQNLKNYFMFDVMKLFFFFSAGSQNIFARYLLCCLKCCFWCLEHFIRFINRNAYIMVSSGLLH